MEKKQFTFRGKTLEELKKLDIREFAKYLGSREKRTALRQFDKIEGFVKKCREAEKKGRAIKTHLREMIVVPQIVGSTVFVYNGREFCKVVIVPEMIGHRLGEFSLTRKKVQHGSPGIGATRSSAAMSVK